MIKAYEVGKKYPEFKTGAEAFQMTMGENGIEFRIAYPRATAKEINNIKSGDIKVKYCVMRNILFVFAKYGELHWMDTYYNPHLNPVKIPEIETGQGLSIVTTFFDSSTGELHALRLYGLEERTSRGIARELNDLMNQPFNEREFAMNAAQVYSSYSTSDLMKFAK